MPQTNVANVSLKKPAGQAKVDRQIGLFSNLVTTVSLAKVRPTVSLAKRPTTFGTATEALLAFFGSQDELRRALGRTDVDAACEIAMSCVKIEIAAGDYERLSGRALTPRAAIRAAFGSQDIQGHWRMDGGKVVTFVEAMQRVMRAA